jgi:hypothetical protein
MSVIKEVADGIKAVAEGIEHIRTVAEAVNDGIDYLKLQHPEIKTDLAAMCAEMRNTSVAVAAASAVLTHFRFTVAGIALDTEPARFNDHLIAHKTKAAKISASLQNMRGHCHVIKRHVDQLRKKASSLNLSRLLLLFGIDSAKREQDFIAALEEIYDDEMQGYLLVQKLSQALQLALDDVAKTLGPPGSALPGNVPAAAALLGEYASAFSELETQSNYLALELQESIDSLD